MKNESLKGILVLGILMLLQTGCNPQGNINEAKEKYNQVIALQNRAKFLRHEGDIDSAISYYKKGIALCYTLVKTNDSSKDTIYSRAIAHLYNYIGFVYDSLRNYDSALTYLMESLKWAKNSKTSKLIVSDDGVIGYIYYDYGKTREQDSQERKSLYKNGAVYFRAGLRTIDSLGILKNKMVLYWYQILKIMYVETGDAANEYFIDKKYTDLYFQLYGHAPAN